MSCGVGRRCGLDLQLLWLWRVGLLLQLQFDHQPGNLHILQVCPLKKKKKKIQGSLKKYMKVPQREKSQLYIFAVQESTRPPYDSTS